DMTRPPRKPIILMINAIKKAWAKLKGVIHHSRAPSKLADKMPPTVPAHVLEGDTLGAISFLPTSLPHTYCNTSEDCTTSIKNSISKICRCLKPGSSRVSRAGTWEIQNTLIMSPHCTFEVRSKKLR